MTHSLIRPSVEELRPLPTLRVATPETGGESMREYCQDRGFDYRLELKLETEEARYWVCTRCVGEPFTGWHEGAVSLIKWQTRWNFLA
jgi:hypothetical protein